MRLLTLFRLPFSGAVLLALAAFLGGALWLAAVAVAAAAAILYLGRDPRRRVPSLPLGVVSPVEGDVVGVDKARDPFLDRDARVVRVAQRVTSPVVLHSPIEGRVERIWCGGGVPAEVPGVVAGIHIRTDEGDDIVFSVSQARLPGPLRWFVQPGERVGQGQRRGMVGWGRTVTVYMPGDSRGEVESGESVRAAADVIARLAHVD